MQQPFITLNLNNIPLSPSSSVKHLGIYIDEQINFKCHIEYIEQKISCAVDVLVELKSFLPLLKLYYAWYTLIYYTV